MENPENDELIAYLDGELDPRTSQQVEERLKHDPAYRQALTLYERSWDMLDRLERATVGENFSRTTLEMVSMIAAKEEQPVPAAGRFDLRRAGIVTLAAVVALLLGYVGGRAIWPDPNRELLQDLQILENLDLYEQAGTIDFLRKVAATGLFGSGAGQAKTPLGMAVPDSPADRRAEIEHMAPLEQEHLTHRRDRFFDRYSLAEKERLREINRALNQSADGRQLRDVLVTYHDWLDTLLPSVRDELDDLPDDERLTRVIEIKAEQETRRAKEREQAPTEQDLVAIIGWFDDFAWRNREALLAASSDKRRQYVESLGEKPQRRALLWMWVSQHGGPGRLRLGQLRFTEADLGHLVDHLSPGARALLDAAQEPQEKKKLISQWGQTAMRHQVEVAGGLRQFLPPVSGAELQRFARDELTSGQREALASMLPYKKFGELLRLYFMSADRLKELKPEEITSRFPARGAGPPRRPAGGPERERGPDRAPRAPSDEKNPPAP